MPHATPPPPAPVPVHGPAPVLSDQSSPLEVFLALARHGMDLLQSLLKALPGMSARYPRHWRLLLDSLFALVRVLLTVRFAPEHFTQTQLRRLGRARHLIQALFGGILPSTPLGTPISRLASAPASAKSDTPSPNVASSTSDSGPLTPDPFHSSHNSHNSHDSHHSHASQNPHSSIPPFIPDLKALNQALFSEALPPNCAGALLDDPADTLIRALQQVHTLIHTFQSPSPSPSQPCENLQSSSVHSVNNVNSVHNVHSVHQPDSVPSPAPAQSEISNLKSEIPNQQSAIFNLQSDIPHSNAPP